ncbi:accessory Sec system protein Asp3 [Staphylococcus xylosus]|uniref:accessory Sec system protein Asp3 n=1 Tax=Staphylococcus xylosus TaxID=1288 RepID=UPI0013049DF6|nr:accessory Sec system protein Asp3 [Staphylococcus xylosus]
MTENNYFEVFWKQINASTFMYGTKLSFKNGVTSFESPLMPSGIIIQDWVMKTSYALDKELPTLPILKRGKDYIFQFNYEVEPNHAVYFKIIFYGKNGAVLTTQIVKEEVIKVTYPEKADTYKVQMINAAAQSIKFQSILISENNNNNLNQVSPEISELFNANPHKYVRNLIFVEPSQLLDFPLTQSAIAHLENVVIINNWSNSIMANLLMIENYINQIADEYEVNLISYGPKGNALVLNLNHLVQVQSFITTDKDMRFNQQLQSQTNKDIEYTQVTAEIYFDPKNEAGNVVDSVVSTVLNPSRYLQHLDITRMNHGGTNETEN